MKESKAVYVTKRDIRENLHRDYQLYTNNSILNAFKENKYKLTKDVGVQYNSKRDNIFYTQRNVSYVRRYRDHDLRYFSPTPKQIFTYSCRSKSFTDIGVGSVKALPKKKVKRIYLPETEDRGVGSSDLSSFISRLQPVQNKNKTPKLYRFVQSYYESKKTSSKCVGGAVEYRPECLVSAKVSPIIHTKSGCTSPKESEFRENAKESKDSKDIEIRTVFIEKHFVTTYTQFEEPEVEVEATPETVNKAFEEAIIHKVSKSSKYFEVINEVKNTPNHSIEAVVDKSTPPKIKSSDAEIDITLPENKSERKLLKGSFSSDSLVQHVYNLEQPSEYSKQRDPMENKMEREYRKMFSRNKKSDCVTEKQQVPQKSTSLFRRRFTAIKKSLGKRESKNDDPTQASIPSVKDASVSSDPPSLVEISVSSLTGYSTGKKTTQKRESFKKSNTGKKNSKTWPNVVIDSEYNQGVKGMFKLWGKKFNLDYSSDAKDDITQPSSSEKQQADDKPTEKGEGPKIIMDTMTELDDEKKVSYKSKEKKERKFLFFKIKHGKDKLKNQNATYKNKKDITTGRCEVKDGLSLRIGGSARRPSPPKSKTPPPPALVIKEKSPSLKSHEELHKTAWLMKFLSNAIESRNSVKVRWNNRKYSASSSTVFELMENIYKESGAVLKSKSEITSDTSSNWSYFHPNVNFAQKVEAWMMPATELDNKTPTVPKKKSCKNLVSRKVSKLGSEIKNIDVSIVDAKHMLKAFARDIEVVLHSKNLARLHRPEKSAEYLKIDIPKGFFSDISTDDPQQLHSSVEEVFNIVEYESSNCGPSAKHTKVLHTGNHPQSQNTVTVKAESEIGQGTQIMEKVKRPAVYRDVVEQGGNEPVPKLCDVIGLGILTKLEVLDFGKPQIMEYLYEEESNNSCLTGCLSNSAKYYLEETYYRHWEPLGMDMLLWCHSDSHMQCCGCKNSSNSYNGDTTKSCPNIYEDYLTLPYMSSWCCDKKKAKEERKVLPKDSLLVFKRRKIYALEKSKWLKSCSSASDSSVNSKKKTKISPNPFTIQEQQSSCKDLKSANCAPPCLKYGSQQKKSQQLKPNEFPLPPPPPPKSSTPPLTKLQPCPGKSSPSSNPHSPGSLPNPCIKPPSPPPQQSSRSPPRSPPKPCIKPPTPPSPKCCTRPPSPPSPKCCTRPPTPPRPEPPKVPESPKSSKSSSQESGTEDPQTPPQRGVDGGPPWNHQSKSCLPCPKTAPCPKNCNSLGLKLPNRDGIYSSSNQSSPLSPKISPTQHKKRYFHGSPEKPSRPRKKSPHSSQSPLCPNEKIPCPSASPRSPRKKTPSSPKNTRSKNKTTSPTTKKRQEGPNLFEIPSCSCTNGLCLPKTRASPPRFTPFPQKKLPRQRSPPKSDSSSLTSRESDCPPTQCPQGIIITIEPKCSSCSSDSGSSPLRCQHGVKLSTAPPVPFSSYLPKTKSPTSPDTCPHGVKLTDCDKYNCQAAPRLTCLPRKYSNNLQRSSDVLMVREEIKCVCSEISVQVMMTDAPSNEIANNYVYDDCKAENDQGKNYYAGGFRNVFIKSQSEPPKLYTDNDVQLVYSHPRSQPNFGLNMKMFSRKISNFLVPNIFKGQQPVTINEFASIEKHKKAAVSKDTDSVMNMIEINFKLRVIPGDKMIEKNVAKDDTITKSNRKTQKSKKILHESAKDVFIDNGEAVAEEANSQNDLNIRILIKNCKPKEKKTVENKTNKPKTVSTDYGNDLKGDHIEDTCFSVHRATIDLTTSERSLISKGKLLLKSSEVIDGKKSKIDRNNASGRSKVLLTNNLSPKNKNEAIRGVIEIKSSNSVNIHSPIIESRHLSRKGSEYTSSNPLDLRSYRVMSSEGASSVNIIDNKLVTFRESKKSVPKSQTRLPFSDADEQDTGLGNKTSEELPSKALFKTSEDNTVPTDFTKSSDPDSDSKTCAAIIEKARSAKIGYLHIRKSKKEEKKAMLKAVFETTNYFKKPKSRSRLKKLKDILKALLTSETESETDRGYKKYEADKAKYIWDPKVKHNSDSLNNFFECGSLMVSQSLTKSQYNLEHNQSDRSALSVDEEKPKTKMCLCNNFAEKLNLENVAGCCCCRSKLPEKINVQISCNFMDQITLVDCGFYAPDVECVECQTKSSRYKSSIHYAKVLSSFSKKSSLIPNSSETSPAIPNSQEEIYLAHMEDVALYSKLSHKKYEHGKEFKESSSCDGDLVNETIPISSETSDKSKKREKELNDSSFCYRYVQKVNNDDEHKSASHSHHESYLFNFETATKPYKRRNKLKDSNSRNKKISQRDTDNVVNTHSQEKNYILKTKTQPEPHSTKINYEGNQQKEIKDQSGDNNAKNKSFSMRMRMKSYDNYGKIIEESSHEGSLSPKAKNYIENPTSSRITVMSLERKKYNSTSVRMNVEENILLEDNKIKAEKPDKKRNYKQTKTSNNADILQMYETKKAVLEIYAEKTVTDGGERMVARLPKYVRGTECRLYDSYGKKERNSEIKSVYKRNFVMMCIGR